MATVAESAEPDPKPPDGPGKGETDRLKYHAGMVCFHGERIADIGREHGCNVTEIMTENGVGIGITSTMGFTPVTDPTKMGPRYRLGMRHADIPGIMEGERPVMTGDPGSPGVN